MKKLIVIILIFIGIGVQAQNERKFVREGNKLFMDAVRDTSKIDTAKYIQAETEYRKALEKKPNDLKWDFNLSDAIYKQRKFEESVENFDRLAEQMEVPVEKARAYHNKGNSELMQQKFDESIESYKKALRLNPTDPETKYNLAYAQLLKKKQEQQQQQQQQNQDQNKDQDKKQDKDQNKDQQNQDQNKDQQNKNQDQNKDQQNKDQQKQQDQKDQQKQQQQNKISKENAEQLLQALQNDESKIQDKVKKAIAAKAKKTKVEKDW